MTARRLLAIFLLLIMGCSLTPATTGQTTEYKEFVSRAPRKEVFEIRWQKNNVAFGVFDGQSESFSNFALKALKSDGEQVFANGQMLFDGSTFVGDPEREYALEDITDFRVVESDGELSIIGYARNKSSRTSRFKSGNRISGTKNLTVREDEFVRGAIFSITGSLDIRGEVNKDVISLTGDIYIGPGAVVRGDLVTLSGNIEVAGSASIYGEIYDSSNKRRGRHGLFEYGTSVDVDLNFVYNRVDGATPYFLDLKFHDEDSTLPSARGTIGYGIASKRWRYGIEIEQPIKRDPAIAAGGSFYQKLATDDEWILGDVENSVFALLATEDFRDYYEAQGGRLFFKIRPRSNIKSEVRFQHEKTRWLSAHPELWSLFGGDKRFGRNFDRVDETRRLIGISEIEQGTNANLAWTLDWDSRDPNGLNPASGWHAMAELEWSDSGLGSDFDYSRYRLRIKRHQYVSSSSILFVTTTFGTSDGYLPIYKRFYLGGLETLRGYKHKEFSATKFWMINAEYRFELPRTGLTLSLLWDAARLAPNGSFGDNDDVKNDLGTALYFGDDLKIELSKRLDISGANLQTYVRLRHGF